MNLGRVVGSVVATRKDERLRGHKLLLVQKLKPGEGGSLIPSRGSSEFLVSVDLVGAGAGELILYTSGSSARNAASESYDNPIDAAIVGIVDQTDIDERVLVL
ncbi:MAG: EutN/CcmL family microcompartment protein [Synergistaceae bacterium]|jgi:ethanolamine utilization protein EutN|nr:EutN/CcmL family microcompartment protein [Synergistaceae bacterium]